MYTLLTRAMHVISLKPIREFYEKPAASKPYLTAWDKTTIKATWENMNDVRLDFPTAELVADGKVIFNIKANHFRLATLLGFKTKKVYVLWIGAHAEYSRIKIKDL
jgi:mRNA interferase HigB